MVFISVLLAMILGTLAYVARLTIIEEARNRHGSQWLADSAPSDGGQAGAKEGTAAQPATRGKSAL